jgi:hypothetical protein
MSHTHGISIAVFTHVSHEILIGLHILLSIMNFVSYFFSRNFQCHEVVCLLDLHRHVESEINLAARYGFIDD